MKKFLTALTAILAVVVMAFALAACSGDKSGSIKKAFEKDGYEITVIKPEDSDLLKGMLSEEQQKDLSKYEVFTCVKKNTLGLPVHSATVFKFPSKDDIIEAAGQEEYDEAVNSGLINGNCALYFTIDKDVINIFKNA